VSTRIPLTLACGDYEIIRPLKEGVVKPDGIDLTILTAMDSTTRHWRFLRGREFDMAEVSCSSYIVARDQGFAATAIPVFLHRRFRHGFVFINTQKGIKKPTDLIGKRVGVKQFQATAIVWMRGILEHEYGVPQKSIEWVSELDETIEFKPPPDLRITKLANNETVEGLLAEGKLDAIIHPDLIKPLVQKDPRVGRLFPNYKQDEIAYYKKTGIFPIMQLVTMRRAAYEQHPWIAMNLYKMFDEAKRRCLARLRDFTCARIPLPWAAAVADEIVAGYGPDPYPYGIEESRPTLEAFCRYAHDQGVTHRRMTIDDLFPREVRAMARV
jgi:4,5-dihydroxyphthalate decarboxylase